MGTNDANGAVDVDKAGDRLDDILELAWSSVNMAKTCFIISTLLPTTHSTGMLYRTNINRQFRALVSTRRAEGRCIYLADMDPNDDGYGYITKADMKEGENPSIHPNVSQWREHEDRCPSSLDLSLINLGFIG